MCGKNGIKMILAVVFMAVMFCMAQADGFIMVPHNGKIFPPPGPRPVPPPPPDFNPFPLEVTYHNVRVEIRDLAAFTTIDQAFFNPTSMRLEGYYMFPVPKGASIKQFTMNIDGRDMEAEMMDAAQARKIYEDIVRSQRDPALLEYVGAGLVKIRIFPIEPRSEKKVRISYRQLLEKDNDTVEYLYPLNTEKFSAKPLSNVSIHVRLEMAEEIKAVFCPSHETDVAHKGARRAEVSYEAKNTRPDTDFRLYCTTRRDNLGFSLLSYKHRGENEDGFFLLSLSPGLDAGDDEVTEKDIAFVLDVSGSMAGEKLQQARRALLFCVENLNRGDRFEIIRFSTEAEGMFRELRPATEENRKQARDFIGGLRPVGGTNIDEALNMALTMKRSGGRPYMIIFITDGKPTIGETNADRLLARVTQVNAASTRIFTFGIGEDLNTYLLDQLTELTRAHRTYIDENEDIEVKVSHFYTRVQSPVLTDIQLSYGGHIQVSKLYPRYPPDLFKGATLVILGRYSGSGDAEIVLKGKLKSGEKTYRFNARNGFKGSGGADADKDDFVAALWASRRVGYLLDQIRLNGPSREIIDEVALLSRKYGIVTPYTSFLILEDEQRRNRVHNMPREFQTLNQLADQTDGMTKRFRQKYEEMGKTAGSPGVRASKDIQKMNVAANVAEQKKLQASDMDYQDEGGQRRNVLQHIKNVQGRAFYNVNNFWIDGNLQNVSINNVIKIKFAGTDYFNLLKSEPQAAQYLAVGKNVRFTMNNRIYEVFE